MLRFINDDETSFHLRAVDRIPKVRYWPAVVGALRRHAEDALHLAPLATGRVCLMWLKTAPDAWSSRRPAAELALKLARAVQAQKRSGEHCDDHLVEAAYEGALYAAADQPGEVASLALELSSRKGEVPEDDSREWDIDSPFSLGSLLDPWPDGPRFRVDDDFAEVCFRRNATLIPLMRARPAVAREVLLALSIEPPRHEHSYSFSDTS
jgi:hypothetical protein